MMTQILKTFKLNMMKLQNLIKKKNLLMQKTQSSYKSLMKLIPMMLQSICKMILCITVNILSFGMML